MEIKVKDLTSVDKEITILANREDLQPKFDQAYKGIRPKVSLPGFRPGKAPIGLIKKRFGQEIEIEEINKYIQEVFENNVVEEHDPVGETQMIDFQWENDELEVTFKIGTKPTVELADLAKVKVTSMVHDVSDTEVDEEIARAVEREGNWEDVDTAIEAESKIIADVSSLDEDGNLVEGDTDTDQNIDMRQESAAGFLKALKGKKAGDVVDMTLEEDGETDRFRVEVKKVQALHKAEMNEEFIAKQTNNEAKTEDEYRSFIKSKMQEYYDQSSDDFFKNDVVQAMVDAHEFDVPEAFVAQVKESYVERLKQQYGNQLPDGFDTDSYKEEMSDQAKTEAKWYFINMQLQEKYDDIEITAEDIDAQLGMEAARYGLTAEQLKGYYAQNPNMLESLRNTIRDNKVFEKLKEEVQIEELSKDDYKAYQEKKQEQK
ncbi:MAG: trigger factor [Bacteroidetes bacterium]|nr:trigger factor [Bacteroidota bacterium]